LQGWIGTFFELGEGDYAGVDGHTPSQYWSDYAWFLEAHSRSLKHRRKHGVSANDVRILAVDKGERDDDWFNEETRPDYRKFVEWHEENNVELRTIATDELAELRADYDLTTSDDVALWIGFAVLFNADLGLDSEELAIKLRVKDDELLSPKYEVLRRFMEDVRKKSTLMNDAAPGVEMGDATLVERWNDYVAPDLRWRPDGRYKRFLEGIIDPERPVLDAAAGSGTDSVNLLRNDYSVISNEVDPRLADQASAFASRRGVTLKLEVSRWEELNLQGNLRFGTVLVLGNSLCLVSSPERRLQALHSFHRVLLPGGKLVIDERNYEFMRQNRERILDDPYESWLTVIDDVMYPGRSLLGFPSLIDDEKVEWSFISNDPPVRSGSEVRERSNDFHPLELYAFQYGELHRDLEEAGFRVGAMFGDLRTIGDGADMPPYEATRDAGFLTYVAERPKGG
jgi:SAM-dependent methyltransferase